MAVRATVTRKYRVGIVSELKIYIRKMRQLTRQYNEAWDKTGRDGVEATAILEQMRSLRRIFLG